MAPPSISKTSGGWQNEGTASVDQSIRCTMRQMVNMIGEIGGIPTNERKNGRTKGVHPVQPEEIHAGAAGSPTLLDRSAPGI